MKRSTPKRGSDPQERGFGLLQESLAGDDVGSDQCSGRGPKIAHRQKISYSFLKIMTGSDLSRRRLPLMVARSPEPGPVVWLTACAHGDEVGGIVVIQEVFRSIQRVSLQKGALFAFPLLNPIGFETGSRDITLSEEDLNRSFPGNKSGTLAERIAEQIFKTIVDTSPSIVLDLHNDWIRSIPYTLLDPKESTEQSVFDKTVRFAQKSGLLVVMDTDYTKKTLSHSLLLHGVPALTVELGESFVVNERNVVTGLNMVMNILACLGMVEPGVEPFRHDLVKPPNISQLTYSIRPYSSTSGIIRFLRRPGDLVRTGQPVAKIYNAFGRLQETITAQGDGVVLGYSDSSVAYPGAPVMAFGINA